MSQHPQHLSQRQSMPPNVQLTSASQMQQMQHNNQMPQQMQPNMSTQSLSQQHLVNTGQVGQVQIYHQSDLSGNHHQPSLLVQSNVSNSAVIARSSQIASSVPMSVSPSSTPASTFSILTDMCGPSSCSSLPRSLFSSPPPHLHHHQYSIGQPYLSPEFGSIHTAATLSPLSSLSSMSSSISMTSSSTSSSGAHSSRFFDASPPINSYPSSSLNKLHHNQVHPLSNQSAAHHHYYHQPSSHSPLPPHSPLAHSRSHLSSASPGYGSTIVTSSNCLNRSYGNDRIDRFNVQVFLSHRELAKTKCRTLFNKKGTFAHSQKQTRAIERSMHLLSTN